MNDPYLIFRAQLVEAATEAPPKLSRPRRWRMQTIALMIAGVAGVSATATAAVITLTGTPSKPVAGPLSKATASDLDGYAITVRADSSSSEERWCADVHLRQAGATASSSTSCWPAPPAGSHLILAGKPQTGAHRILFYAVVDAQVAAARLSDGRVIEAVGQPGLPRNWKLIAADVKTDSDLSGGGDDLPFTLLGAAGAVVASPTSIEQAYRARS